MIVRTRQEDVFDLLDIVVDVGGIYDADRNRYDHHQATFEESWNNSPDDITKLSSAGLVFRHFGREVITNAVKDNWGVTLEGPRLEKVYQKVYKKLILEVDALDNGMNQFAGKRFHLRKASSWTNQVILYIPGCGDKDPFSARKIKKAN